MSDNEPTKRKRLSLACNICRRKKIKCDGERPSCGKCIRMNENCEYTDVVRKRGPRQGHIDLLEQRLKKMEELIKSGSSVLEASPSSIAITHQPLVGKRSSQSTTSSASLLSAMSSPAQPASATPAAPELSNDIKEESHNWPPIDVVDHLVLIYFQHFETMSPIADVGGLKASIRDRSCNIFLLYAILSVAARYSKRVDIAENPLWMSGEKFASKARSMMGYVTETPCIEHVQGLSILALNEYGCARNYRCYMYTGLAIRMALEIGLHKELMFKESPGNILPLERWFWYENRRKLFWDIYYQDKLSSAATGRPQLLDYRDTDLLLPVYNSTLDLSVVGEIYQRNLDGTKMIRYNIHRNPYGHVTGIQISYIDVSELHGHHHLFNKLGLETRIMELIALLGRITSYINREIQELPLGSVAELDKLNKALDDWVLQLPPSMRNTPANLDYYRQQHTFQAGQYVLAHVLHNTLLVLLNRPALLFEDIPKLNKITQELRDKMHANRDKCLSAADNVIVMLKDLVSQFDIIPPHTIYFAYVTATVMVNNTFTGNNEECKKSELALQELYKFYKGMKVYWAMAEKMDFLTKDLFAVHLKVIDTYQKNQLTSLSTSSGSSFQTASTVNISSVFSDNFTRKLPATDMSVSSSDWNTNYALQQQQQQDLTNIQNSFGGASFDIWLQQQQEGRQ